MNDAAVEQDGPARGVDPVNTLVFWWLTALAVAAFAPCILLPEWRAYESLWVAEQAELHRLDALEKVVERERRLLEAVQSDPAVLSRLAQRELKFRVPGGRRVIVFAEAPPGSSDVSFTPVPPEPPALVARILSYAPVFNYDALFCAPETRTMIMGMSIALLGVALWLPRGTVARS